MALYLNIISLTPKQMIWEVCTLTKLSLNIWTCIQLCAASKHKNTECLVDMKQC